MHDHKSENFIKINPNARRIASGLFKPRLVKPHTCFQRANRKTGRPQSGVKSATLCVWECSLIYRLFVVMSTKLNLKRNKFRHIMKPVEAYKVATRKQPLIFLYPLFRDGNSKSNFMLCMICML